MLSAIRFLRSFSAELRKLESPPELLPLKGSSLKALVYPRADACSTLLIIPGIHPSGIFDPRLHAFAKACCSAGFQVLAPDIEDSRNLKVTTRSIDQIEELVATLTQNFPASTLRKTGILGISYGAGPVFVAASRNNIRKSVQFLVSIGGYADFRRSLEFATMGTVAGKKETRVTQEYGRAIFALNHMEDFLPAESHAKMREMLLHLLPPANERPARELELSDREKRFLEEIRSGFAKEIATTNAILQRNEAAWKELSPLTYLERLDRAIRIYLLHGREDDLVPFEETEELNRALHSLGFQNVRALVTASLSHVDVQRTRDLLGYIQLLFWLRSVLSESR